MTECNVQPYIFTFLLQVLIMVITLYSLLIKFYREINPRTQSVFFRDTYKQAISEIFNIFLYYGFAQSLNIPICSSYYLFLWSDLFVFMPLFLISLKCTNRILERRDQNIYVQGQHLSERLEDKAFLAQSAIFFILFFINKIFVFFVLVYPLAYHWNILSKITLYSISSDPIIQYILTIVVFPFLFHINRFWITDEVIKGKGQTSINTITITDDQHPYCFRDYADL